MNRVVVAVLIALACSAELGSGFLWDQDVFRISRGASASNSASRATQSGSGPVLKNFTQRLDHFNIFNRRTWLQRYWVDSSNFNGNGPVFLVISEATRASPSLITSQQIASTASTFNALVVLVEHRFFGDSIPNMDLSLDNLKYLTIMQALEDLACIRKYVHSSYGLTNANKWIAFGPSYGGSLAAWLRLKYPNLVNGAVAVSAQINARFDAAFFFENVAKIINAYNPACTQAIQRATDQLSNMIKTQRSSLQSIFSTCTPVATNSDVLLLLYQTAYYFSFSAEYYNTYTLPSGYDLASACQIMTNQTIGTELTRYAQYITQLIGLFQYPCLLSSYDILVAQVKNTNDLVSGFRSTMYFYCTQLGVFPSTHSGNHPFNHDVWTEFWIAFCNDAFGFKFSYYTINAAMSLTNAIYGGLNYKGSVAVFVSGTLDPWRDIYITSNSMLTHSNSNIEVVEIEGVSTFYDLTSVADSAAVSQAITKINSLIQAYV